MRVRLTDEDYKITINYTLNFDVIGKIEIYKEFKQKVPIQTLYTKSAVSLE